MKNSHTDNPFSGFIGGSSSFVSEAGRNISRLFWLAGRTTGLVCQVKLSLRFSQFNTDITEDPTTFTPGPTRVLRQDLFRDVHGTNRPSAPPFVSYMQDVYMSEMPSCSLEALRFMNFNHNARINMDRIVHSGETPSFVPMDIGKSYLNEVVVYYKNLFGKFPCEYYGIDYDEIDRELDLAASMKSIDENFKTSHRLIYRTNRPGSKKVEIIEVNYILDDGILLYMSEAYNSVIVVYNSKDQLDRVLSNIKARKQRKKVDSPRFKLLVHSAYGFSTETFELKQFDVNVGDNYNDDIPDEKIRNFIEADGEAGLCILHGKPGTGKTYYIRDLIKNSRRDFIYMNKECLQYINDSSFIAFLTKSKDSVFIMEDCENVLADRVQYNNTISTLLNLSDGLLGDSLNNKFICTFNTDISNIDEALLRKGRMKVCYEFKYLNRDKANALAEKLHKKDRFDKDVPLCEVMNSESNGSEDIPPRKVSKIGF